MAARIEVEGLDDLEAALAEYRDAALAALAEAIDDELDAATSDARNHVRVDTGDLRDSITGERDGLSGTVAPRYEASNDDDQDNYYGKASANEFGTSSDPGQPYMVPAAEASRQRWPGRVADAIERAKP